MGFEGGGVFCERLSELIQENKTFERNLLIGLRLDVVRSQYGPRCHSTRNPNSRTLFKQSFWFRLFVFQLHIRRMLTLDPRKYRFRTDHLSGAETSAMSFQKMLQPMSMVAVRLPNDSREREREPLEIYWLIFHILHSLIMKSKMGIATRAEGDRNKFHLNAASSWAGIDAEHFCMSTFKTQCNVV